jgi:hypothetical protein
MKTVQEELSAFERRETEFQKKEREERAAELRIPLNAGDRTH